MIGSIVTFNPVPGGDGGGSFVHRSGTLGPPVGRKFTERGFVESCKKETIKFRSIHIGMLSYTRSWTPLWIDLGRKGCDRTKWNSKKK
jgi:hypothetical protein